MSMLPDTSTRVTAASYPAFQAETSYVPAGTSIVATPAPSVAALNAPTRTWTSSKRSVRVGSRDCDRDAVFRRSDNNELESGRRPLMPRRGCSRPDVNGPGVLTQRGGCGEIEVSPVQRARVRPRCRPKRPSANCQTRSVQPLDALSGTEINGQVDTVSIGEGSPTRLAIVSIPSLTTLRNRMNLEAVALTQESWLSGSNSECSGTPVTQAIDMLRLAFPFGCPITVSAVSDSWLVSHFFRHS